MIHIKATDDKVLVVAQHSGYVLTVSEARRLRNLLNHAIHMAEGVEARENIREVVHRIIERNQLEVTA